MLFPGEIYGDDFSETGGIEPPLPVASATTGSLGTTLTIDGSGFGASRGSTSDYFKAKSWVFRNMDINSRALTVVALGKRWYSSLPSLERYSKRCHREAGLRTKITGLGKDKLKIPEVESPIILSKAIPAGIIRLI